MNDEFHKEDKRGKTLIVVEGKHEKNCLFWALFKSFPELGIDMDDVWIYGTNIYQLYDDIVRNYGKNWIDDDVDLPFVISSKKEGQKKQYKRNFTNIVLVFDYERHDQMFSENKIMEMQTYFKDETDVGKLYINYPMIESYCHFQSLPDQCFAERKIPVTCQPGKEYKTMVNNDSCITKTVNLPHKLDGILKTRYLVQNDSVRDRCIDRLFRISDSDEILCILEDELSGNISQEALSTAKNHLKRFLEQQGHFELGLSYYGYLRWLFQQIIFHNILKGNRILSGNYDIPKERHKECFEGLNLIDILKKQNECSRDEISGFIWVLNTCVYFVPNYNFNLLYS